MYVIIHEREMITVYPTSTATSSEMYQYFNLGKFHFTKSCETRYFYDHDNIGAGNNADLALLTNQIQQCYDPLQALLGVSIFILWFIGIALGVTRMFHNYFHHA